MSALMYLAGIICVVAAVVVGVEALQASNSLLSVVAVYQVGSSLGAGLLFFGFGRGLDLLTDIAGNSDYLAYLERLDPEVAEQRAAERAASAERKSRSIWRRMGR